MNRSDKEKAATSNLVATAELVGRRLQLCGLATERAGEPRGVVNREDGLVSGPLLANLSPGYEEVKAEITDLAETLLAFVRSEDAWLLHP